MLHTDFLTATCSTWREYLGGMRQTVNELNEKARFSRVGRACQHDYEITFTDVQRLQGLRQKLLRCSSMLESMLSICDGIELQCNDLGKHGVTSYHTHVQLEMHRSQLRGHRRAVDTLLTLTGDTSLLLSHILKYRSDELIEKSNDALQNSVAVLGRIANDTKRESEHMGRLSEQTNKDSRSMRVLTSVASLYLPATFVATLFSSNLIQMKGGASTDGATRLVLSKETWIYALVTVVLTIMTVVLTLSLERQWFHGALFRRSKRETNRVMGSQI